MALTLLIHIMEQSTQHRHFILPRVMVLSRAYIVYFICIGSMHVQAGVHETTFSMSPSRNISNSDYKFFARSLTECTIKCMNVYNRSTAAYSAHNNLCYVSTTSPEVIVDIADNDIITISMDKDEASQYGTDFITGFMTNGYNNAGVPHLMLVSAVPTNVWVTIPYLQIYQEHHLLDGQLYLQYSNSLMPQNSSVITENGVEVTSDKPITLFSFNYQAGSSDGTLELPKDLLGQLYIVDTHNSTMLGLGQIVVTAVFNNTEVSLMFPSGSNEIIMLNKFETYQRQATADEHLSGTMISANSSVSVHAGHECANVPNHSVLYCDVLVTAVPPVKTFGRVFIVPYQRPRANYSIGVAVPFDGTEVTILNSNGSLIEIVQLNKRDSILRDFSSSQTISVTSTQGILVTQYGHGSHHIYGDPSLVVIAAINQFGGRYDFAVPPMYDDPGIVSVVIASLYDSAGLMLNGSPLNVTESVTVTIPGAGDFTVMYINVIKNVTYRLYHSDSYARFGAWLYARNYFEEYTTVLGYNI